MEDLAEKVKAINLNQLIEDAGLTSDEFVLLSYSLGGTEEAIDSLKRQVEEGKKANEDYGGSFSAMVAGLLEFTQAAIEQIEPLLTERAELFADFQLDMTDISQEEGQKREDVEGRYEERRTDIVERYADRRALAEEDYQRRRLRNEEKLASDLQDAQEDSYERQAEIRENADQRMADLERDHANRMTDIIRDADLRLQEAAGRLSAAAVVSIQQQRKAALEDEEKAYARSREDIQRTLDQQLNEEQAASAERIADMQGYFTERQRLDEEDHQIRLDRMESANADQLAVLDERHQQELVDIFNAASAARYQRQIAYVDERTALGDHLGEREKLEAAHRKSLLLEEEKWWRDRQALIPQPLPGAGSTSLPAQFFGQAASPGVGNVTFHIYETDSPQETGQEVERVLGRLFGAFGDRPGL
jgi:hypothetical protein